MRRRATERIIPKLHISKLLSSIKKRTVRNVSYIGASQIITLLLSLITVAVLTRMLTPEDFGIVSIGMIFMALFANIQDFGVAPAVIQRDTRIEESISVGLALRWIIAIILMIFVIGVSPLVSSFYGKPAIALVLIVMSLNLFVQPISFSSLVLLTRALNFYSLAIAGIVQYMVITGVSISLALFGFSYWSLVLGSLAGSVSYVVVLRNFESTSFRPRIDRGLVKELLGFGMHLLIVGLMAFIVFNVDQLVVGKVFGVAMLGIYFVAVRFGRTMGEQISGTVNKVLFPTMARMKDSIEQLKIGQIQSLRMIAIITVPLSMGLSALSSLFVEVVLGSDWTAVGLPIAILSFQGLLNALIAPSANVLVSIGKPKYMSAQATVQALLLVIAIYPVASFYGINGVCVLTTALSFSVMIYFVVVFSRVFKSKILDIVGPIMPSLFSGVVTFVVLALCSLALPANLVSLVALTFLGGLVYVGFLHYLSKGKDLRDFSTLVRTSLLHRQES